MCGTPALTVFHTPREVNVDHVGPVAFAGLVQRRATVADARVGDDDVQPAQLLHAGVHRGFQRVVVAYVDFGGVDAAVVALDQIRGLGQILGGGQRNPNAVDLLADVDRDDVGAFLRQPHRVAAALAACRAGDERDLAFNSAGHRLPLSIFRRNVEQSLSTLSPAGVVCQSPVADRENRILLRECADLLAAAACPVRNRTLGVRGRCVVSPGDGTRIAPRTAPHPACPSAQAVSPGNRCASLRRPRCAPAAPRSWSLPSPGT